MKRTNALKKSLGYSILELSIATAILSTVTVAGLKYYKNQVDLDRAQNLAKVYKNLNTAIGTYIALYYSELRTLSPTCSTVALGEGAVTTSVDYSSCSLSIPVAEEQKNQLDPIGRQNIPPPVVVANAMQPTVAELVKLGILHQEASDVPPYEHHKTVLNAQKVYEPFRFAFLIEQVCVSAPRTPAVRDLPRCKESNQDLRTYVYNTQPYLGPNATDAAKQASWLGEVAAKAGPDAAVTSTTTPSPGELYGHKGAWELRNPIRNLSSGKGMTNMVVMVNGFGASENMQLTRRDGSMWPTDNWDFNQMEIRNVKGLEVTGRLVVPKKKLGETCDFNTERTAFDDDARAFLICDKNVADLSKSTWLHTRGKGAANWEDYIDVTLTAIPRRPNSKESDHDTYVTFADAKGPTQKSKTPIVPAIWKEAGSRFEFEDLDFSLYGMPTLLEQHTLGYRQRIQDQGCSEMASWVNAPLVGAAEVGVYVSGYSTPDGWVNAGGGGGGPIEGFATGIAGGWCTKWKENDQFVSQTPEFKLAVNPVNKKWQIHADMKFGGQLTVRFHKLYQ